MWGRCGWLMAERCDEQMEIGWSRARGFPFVRIEPGQYGLVWQRCVPTEAQRLARIAHAEFASAQADWFVDPEGQADPDGGLADDDEWFDASWDDEAWDYPGA